MTPSGRESYLSKRHAAPKRSAARLLAVLAFGLCAGCNLTGSDAPSPTAAAPSAPPTNMAGRWMLSSTAGGQCRMNFGATSPTAAEGTIAPEGGCPGKFFTSRKWSYEGGLVIRDHTGQPLAQLSGGAAQFTGQATSGEAITLAR